MPNEVDTEPGKAAPTSLTKGQLIGSVVGVLALAGTLALIFGPRPGEWFWVTFLLGWCVGGAVGGVIELRRQRRSAEVAGLPRQQFLGLLPALPIFLGAWLAQRLYGDVGWWAGFLGVGGLLAAGLWLARYFQRNPAPRLTEGRPGPTPRNHPDGHQPR
jgi:hypothetical protein